MPAVDLKVYGAILSVRPARRFDIACLLMRMYGYMMDIGTVAMLSLAGYSFLESGLVSSVIALAIFLIGPRLGKLVDERGQSRVVPFAALVSLTGLVALLITVQFHGPLWILFIASVFVGCIPSAQALSRARWVYLLRMGKLGEKAPNVTTIFSYEGILDDIGFMIAPALSIFLASSFTPIAGLAVGGVCFLIGATLLTHAKETEPHPGWRSATDTASSDAPASNSSTPEKSKAPAKEKKSLFRTSRIVRVLFVLMLLLGSFFGTFDTTSVAFAEELGEPNIASGALMLSALVSIAIGFLFGTLRLAIPHYKQVLIAATCIGVGYGSMMLISDAVSLYVVSCFGALFYAPFLIVMNGACERSVPGKRLTEAITWLNAGCTCGLAIGPTLAGIMIDLWGAQAGFIMGGVLALAIPVIALLHRRTIKTGRKSTVRRAKIKIPEAA